MKKKILYIFNIKWFYRIKINIYHKMGIGDWGLGPIPNPQSPIPNPQCPISVLFLFLIFITK